MPQSSVHSPDRGLPTGVNFLHHDLFGRAGYPAGDVPPQSGFRGKLPRLGSRGKSATYSRVDWDELERVSLPVDEGEDTVLRGGRSCTRRRSSRIASR